MTQVRIAGTIIDRSHPSTSSTLAGRARSQLVITTRTRTEGRGCDAGIANIIVRRTQTND